MGWVLRDVLEECLRDDGLAGKNWIDCIRDCAGDFMGD